MDFWRLSNFALERLPSTPEVHLFRAVARENPRDERLVALGEVRDLSPVRDESGTITALPQLERTVRQAFESMRSVQSGRRPRERLLWNRLLLYVWPLMDFGPEDAGAIIERFTRITAELGHRDGDGARPDRRERRRARARAAALQPGRARRHGGGHRPAGASRSSRSTRAPSGSSPRAGAGRCTPPRSSRSSPRSGRSATRRSRPASSSSTTSTRTATSCPSTGRRRPTRRASSSG